MLSRAGAKNYEPYGKKIEEWTCRERSWKYVIWHVDVIVRDRDRRSSHVGERNEKVNPLQFYAIHYLSGMHREGRAG